MGGTEKWDIGRLGVGTDHLELLLGLQNLVGEDSSLEQGLASLGVPLPLKSVWTCSLPGT